VGEVEPVEVELCADLPQQLISSCPGALIVEWVVLNTPPGVNASDVTFDPPGNFETMVTVPLEGTYSFAIECCLEA